MQTTYSEAQAYFDEHCLEDDDLSYRKDTATLYLATVALKNGDLEMALAMPRYVVNNATLYIDDAGEITEMIIGSVDLALADDAVVENLFILGWDDVKFLIGAHFFPRVPVTPFNLMECYGSQDNVEFPELESRQIIGVEKEEDYVIGDSAMTGEQIKLYVNHSNVSSDVEKYKHYEYDEVIENLAIIVKSSYECTVAQSEVSIGPYDAEFPDDESYKEFGEKFKLVIKEFERFIGDKRKLLGSFNATESLLAAIYAGLMAHGARSDDSLYAAVENMFVLQQPTPPSFRSAKRSSELQKEDDCILKCVEIFSQAHWLGNAFAWNKASGDSAVVSGIIQRNVNTGEHFAKLDYLSDVVIDELRSRRLKLLSLFGHDSLRILKELEVAIRAKTTDCEFRRYKQLMVEHCGPGMHNKDLFVREGFNRMANSYDIPPSNGQHGSLLIFWDHISIMEEFEEMCSDFGDFGSAAVGGLQCRVIAMIPPFAVSYLDWWQKRLREQRCDFGIYFPPKVSSSWCFLDLRNRMMYSEWVRPYIWEFSNRAYAKRRRAVEIFIDKVEAYEREGKCWFGNPRASWLFKRPGTVVDAFENRAYNDGWYHLWKQKKVGEEMVNKLTTSMSVENVTICTEQENK